MEDVRIGVTVESMRYAVLHAFAAHQGVMQEIVDVKLKAALDTWRIEDEIDREIERVLRGEISRMISDEVRNVLLDREIRNALELSISDAFRAGLAARGLIKGESDE